MINTVHNGKTHPQLTSIGEEAVEKEIRIIDIKCPSGQIEELQDRYEGIKPGYHMNKKHWGSVYFDKDVPEKTIKELVKQSYNRVAASRSGKPRIR